MPLEDLVQARDALGPIEELDLTAWELPAAHAVLGEVVAEQVHRHLAVKLAGLSGGDLALDVRVARECRAETVRRMHSASVPTLVGHMVALYHDCLGEWAEGARLHQFASRELGSAAVDGVPIDAWDLAFLLQLETIGCQTGVMRLADGSVVIWHTEEDRAHQGYSRFDRLRLASFRCEACGQGRIVTGFLYPDLLLGPAFGWVDQAYIQAVDSLYLDPQTHLAGVPANLVTWVNLFLAGAMPTEDVVRALAPTHNGYAVAAACRRGARILADVTEFVDGAMHRTEIDDRAGAAHFQVNILSESAGDLVPGRECVDPEIERMLIRRRWRAQRALGVIRRLPDSADGCARLLGSRVGGATANANPDVKAHFLGQLAPDGATFRVGAGPGIRQGAFHDPLRPFDAPPV